MDRILYLEANIDNFSRPIFKAFQACLTPEESCLLISRNLMINSKMRNYPIRKIKKEIETSYSDFHKRLVAKLLKVLTSNRYKYLERNRSSLILYDLYPVLSKRTKTNILKKMITSKYKPVRDRGYKILQQNKDNSFREIIQSNWETYFDPYAGEIICKHFPNEYIYSQIDYLKEVMEDWRIRQVYAKLSPDYPQLIENLKDSSPLDYIYMMAKNRIICNSID